MGTVLTAEDLDNSDKGVSTFDSNGNTLTIQKSTTGTVTTVNVKVTAR